MLMQCLVSQICSLTQTITGPTSENWVCSGGLVFKMCYLISARDLLRKNQVHHAPQCDQSFLSIWRIPDRTRFLEAKWHPINLGILLSISACYTEAKFHHPKPCFSYIFSLCYCKFYWRQLIHLLQGLQAFITEIQRQPLPSMNTLSS